MKPTSHLYSLAVCLWLVLLAACGASDAADAEAQQDPVRSHLSGRITVSAEVDSIPDYRDFEVIVAFEQAQQMDTLGYARTDSTGYFETDVVAPDRGIYALVIKRRGTVLKVDELAVADGDSATVAAVLPIGNRPLRIRSQENGAWAAFRNTKAQHNNALVQILQGEGYSEDAVQGAVMRTSSILWSMQDAYPKTIGRDLAMAEAVMMLGGWDDSLAVARARQIQPDNPSYANVAGVARQAMARLAGPDSAIALVRDFQARTDDEDQRAHLHTELVLAYIDSGQQEAAIAEARALGAQYPGSRWSAWSERAIYELENLMPGMDAPALSVTTVSGETLSLDTLRGRLVLLEFYAPQNTNFQRETEARKTLYDTFAEQPFTLVSLSLEPDTLLNEAFWESYAFPGEQVILSGTARDDLMQRYNINVIPTRFLIDQNGKIVGKYVGTTLPQLQNDVMVLLSEGG